ncbi:hypothetical protein B9G98_03515 [Wickerhamiella sorbophila]|uniref:Cytochrome b-c1 complex subunit 10 n=1 Tax=Wickerhamiella sorbophila TaxID=45607 RepID=A0A2T0FLP4_9ASCO|nr:hypothetical protein B9G98_03515 [Wickerhamiella sorbophila]PRT55895.1 hypothetical protein B9G98_03515 [Wickerhamiella sorbophila]
MVSGTYRIAPSYKKPVVAGGIFTLPKVFRWTPTLALWGATTGVAAIFFCDSITLLRRDVYSKLPIFGSYYSDHVDPEDTPF